MWKTAWDITSANSGAKRLQKNPDVTSWAEGQIRQVVPPSSLVPGPLSTLADRGRGLAPPPPCVVAGPIRSYAPRRRHELPGSRLRSTVPDLEECFELAGRTGTPRAHPIGTRRNTPCNSPH